MAVLAGAESTQERLCRVGIPARLPRTERILAAA